MCLQTLFRKTVLHFKKGRNHGNEKFEINRAKVRIPK